MGKSRARVPSYYRQSIQNAVNRQINLGRTKMATSLNREAIGQVVSYCFVAAAHDILDFDAGKAAVLTVKMNNAAERYTLDRDKRGARKARIEDGEMVAYEKLCRMVEGIYGVGAMVERVNGQGPIFGTEF